MTNQAAAQQLKVKVDAEQRSRLQQRCSALKPINVKATETSQCNYKAKAKAKTKTTTAAATTTMSTATTATVSTITTTTTRLHKVDTM